MALISSGVLRRKILQHTRNSTAESVTHEVLELMLVFDLYGRLSALADNLEWPVLKIPLDIRIIEVATNQT